MRRILIQDKLRELDVTVEGIVLGDFDLIGEISAKKRREPSEANYAKVGAFFRPNYERGVLIHSLITRFKLKSVLEIGFGRGYGSLCAAKAFYDMGIAGKVVSIDPTPAGCTDDERWTTYRTALAGLMPDLMRYVDVKVGTSAQIIPKLSSESYDLVYIDGDHSYEGTKLDWQLTASKFNRFLLFDDYHMPTKNDPGIQCRRAIDEIDWEAANCHEPDLIIGDRRMFVDDRGLRDDEINYGQCLVTRKQST